MSEQQMIVSIESDSFAEIRLSFDRTLETVLKKMKVRDSDKAQITMSVGIKLENIKTTDTRTGEIMNVKNPEITYKINHKLEYKTAEEESGKIQQADSYIVCEGGVWKIKRIEDGQMTIDEYVEKNGRK